MALLSTPWAPSANATPLVFARFIEDTAGSVPGCETVRSRGSADDLPETVGFTATRVGTSCGSRFDGSFLMEARAITFGGFDPRAYVDGHATGQFDLGNIFVDARAEVYYIFALDEKELPPSTGVLVPVVVKSEGLARVGGSGARADASLVMRNLSLLPGAQITFTASADKDTPGDEFHLNRGFAVHPLSVHEVTLFVLGQVSNPGDGRTGSFLASLDPVIEVADVPFPGTDRSFREFYEVVFSPGLVMPEPVVPEPGTAPLLLTGAALIAWARRRSHGGRPDRDADRTDEGGSGSRA